MDMSVNIAGVEWKNPVTVASGTFGSGAEFADYVDINKLGAVTTKGVANSPVNRFRHLHPLILINQPVFLFIKHFPDRKSVV